MRIAQKDQFIEENAVRCVYAFVSFQLPESFKSLFKVDSLVSTWGHPQIIR